jgi:hypothetical protein
MMLVPMILQRIFLYQRKSTCVAITKNVMT